MGQARRAASARATSAVIPNGWRRPGRHRSRRLCHSTPDCSRGGEGGGGRGRKGRQFGAKYIPRSNVPPRQTDSREAHAEVARPWEVNRLRDPRPGNAVRSSLFPPSSGSLFNNRSNKMARIRRLCEVGNQEEDEMMRRRSNRSARTTKDDSHAAWVLHDYCTLLSHGDARAVRSFRASRGAESAVRIDLIRCRPCLRLSGTVRHCCIRKRPRPRERATVIAARLARRSPTCFSAPMSCSGRYYFA